MAYEGYFVFGDVEIVNLARTWELSQALGIHSVRIRASSVDWLYDDVEGFGFGLGGFGYGGFGGGTGYDDITTAPWYDAGFPASGEFAGIIPLRVDGLYDSSLESTATEYITDGGNAGITRNATLPLVWNVALVASTKRGAEYGKRWMDRVLRGSGPRTFCDGATLQYYRYAEYGSPVAHRRDVKLTRGSSVTRKREHSCSAVWIATFTMTAADPYEYGEPAEQFTGLGGTVTGDEVDDSDDTVLVQSSCPVYDYSPIYDPVYPSLVPSPVAPDFYPAGWNIEPGMTFERFWVTLNLVEPVTLNVVPIVLLTTTEEARMVRFSLWSAADDITDQCDPLWSVVVSYLPADMDFYIDGEQRASYVWDGVSSFVRRTDSLVYSPDAEPIQWTAFNDSAGLRATLDIFSESDLVEGGGNVRAQLFLVPKSD